MKFVISAIMAVLCSVLAYFTLDHQFVHQNPLLRHIDPDEPTKPEDDEKPTDADKSAAGDTLAPSEKLTAGDTPVKSKKPAGVPDETETKIIGKTARIVIAAVLGVLSAVAAWFACGAEDPIESGKLLIALLCLNGSGCVDYLEHRIPNIFPIIMGLSGIILLVVGALTKQEAFHSHLMGSLITGVGFAIFFGLAAALSKGGVGMGDIKLLATLGLLAGFWVTFGALFASMLLCSITAVVLLLLKKKSLKGSLPFGPFILFGYILSVCLKNY